MARDITSAMQTQSDASTKRPVILAKLEYDSGDILMNSTTRTITYNSEDYLGIGNFGSISPVEETSDLKAQGIEAKLNGIEGEANLSTALSENYQGRPATFYFGYLDSDYALIADPFIIFKGKMDNQKITVGQVGQIILSIESQFADWKRPRVSRYNNGSQQARFEGDLGFEFVEQTTEKAIFWGRDR